MIRKILLFFLFLVSAALNSCAGEDGAQSVCANYECVDGIYPGVTTFEEAEALLTEKYGAQNVDNRSSNDIDWDPSKRSDYRWGDLHANQQGIVEHINVRPAEGKLTVSDLIAQIGAPDTVYVARLLPCAFAFIRFVDDRVNASLYPENDFIGVTPDQNISGLELLSPQRAEDYYMTDTAVIPWQGYSDYCEIAYPDGWQ